MESLYRAIFVLYENSTLFNENLFIMYKCFEPIPFSYYNRNLIIRLIQCKSWTMIKINLTFYLYRQCTLFSFWNTLKLFVFHKSMFVYFYIHVYAVYLHKSNWCIFIFVKMLTCIYKQRLHFYLLHRCTFQTEVYEIK